MNPPIRIAHTIQLDDEPIILESGRQVSIAATITVHQYGEDRWNHTLDCPQDIAQFDADIADVERFEIFDATGEPYSASERDMRDAMWDAVELAITKASNP